jgi:hypothetical protein
LGIVGPNLSIHFTFHSFNHRLLPKFVSLIAKVARAEFMSLQAVFITVLNGNARASVDGLFHLVNEENHCEVQSGIALSDK